MTQLDKENSINSSNWTYTYRAAGPLRVQVNLTAEPADTPENSILYSVTVLKNELKEISVTDFQDLKEACHYLNERYKTWRIVDQSLKKDDKSDGCSSCVAH